MSFPKRRLCAPETIATLIANKASGIYARNARKDIISIVARRFVK